MDTDMMNLVAWLIIGGLAGWLASLLMGTYRNLGVVLDIIVGIVGALIGGFLFNAIGVPGATGFNLWSLFVAFMGAIVLLGVIRLFTGTRVTA